MRWLWAAIVAKLVEEDLSVQEMRRLCMRNIRKHRVHALEPVEKAAAKERMKAGRAPSGNFPKGIGGETRDCIGAFAGVSGRKVEKIVEVVEAAQSEQYNAAVAAIPQSVKGRAPGRPPRVLSPLVKARSDWPNLADAIYGGAVMLAVSFSPSIRPS